MHERCSDDEKYPKMAADVGEANVSTQRALLSEVIGELKSVSVMMSSTLQLAAATSRRDGDARNISHRNNNKLPAAALDVVLHSADSQDRRLVFSSAAETNDKDDDDYSCEQYSNNDDTCTTEVCIQQYVLSIRH